MSETQIPWPTFSQPRAYRDGQTFCYQPVAAVQLRIQARIMATARKSIQRVLDNYAASASELGIKCNVLAEIGRASCRERV